MYTMMNLVTTYTKLNKWQPAGIYSFVNSSIKVLGKESSKTRDRIETLVFVLRVGWRGWMMRLKIFLNYDWNGTCSTADHGLNQPQIIEGVLTHVNI